MYNLHVLKKLFRIGLFKMTFPQLPHRLFYILAIRRRLYIIRVRLCIIWFRLCIQRSRATGGYSMTSLGDVTSRGCGGFDECGGGPGTIPAIFDRADVGAAFSTRNGDGGSGGSSSVCGMGDDVAFAPSSLPLPPPPQNKCPLDNDSLLLSLPLPPTPPKCSPPGSNADTIDDGNWACDGNHDGLADHYHGNDDNGHRLTAGKDCPCTTLPRLWRSGSGGGGSNDDVIDDNDDVDDDNVDDANNDDSNNNEGDGEGEATGCRPRCPNGISVGRFFSRHKACNGDNDGGGGNGDDDGGGGNGDDDGDDGKTSLL